MTVSPRLYVGTVTAVLLVWILTIAFPRYGWRDQSQGPTMAPMLVRIDRWTGRVDQGMWISGQWISRSVACRTPATKAVADACHAYGL